VCVEDLQPGDDGGATVAIRRSKTDQLGEGATAYLGPEAYDALRAWLDAAGITSGPRVPRGERARGVAATALGAAGDPTCRSSASRSVFTARYEHHRAPPARLRRSAVSICNALRVFRRPLRYPGWLGVAGSLSQYVEAETLSGFTAALE
jgi:hypothetical protein